MNSVQNVVVSQKTNREREITLEQLALRKVKAFESPPPLPRAHEHRRLWRWLKAAFGALRPAELVREVAPGKLPLKRHQWEKPRYLRPRF